MFEPMMMKGRTEMNKQASWALVTGASGGIGMEMARDLAAQGHALVLVARKAGALQQLADELRQRHGTETLVVALDLSAPEAADQVAEKLREAGIEPAVLVNNAGIGLFGLHTETRLDDEQAMINLNVVTLTRLTKLLLPAMVARRQGRVLNVASTAAFQPGPYMAVYYATKAYVLSYSEALAEELAGTGVTVTALCPGPTSTGFDAAAQASDSGLFKGKRLPDAKSVADFAVEAMNRGRRVAVHGTMNCVMAQSIRFTPRRVVTKMVARMSRPS
jgi:short-subunit dehydrogenase